MTPDELIDIVGRAYGEPTDEIAEELFSLVHKTYDQTASEEEQLINLLVAVERVRSRVTRVITYVATLHDTAPLECDENLPF